MKERRWGMNREEIKLAAVAAMTLNHLANALLDPSTVLYEVFVDIGYFTAITMCFFLVESYHRTRSKRRYGLRLLVFAGVSFFPFCLANGVWQMNMIFTLFLCFLILWAMEQIASPLGRAGAVAGLTALSLFSDWALLAPAFTILFELARGDRRGQAFGFAAGAALFGMLNYAEYSARFPAGAAALHAGASVVGILVSGVVLLNFYNGRKSPRAGRFSKWFFYVYYPAHLLVLGILRITLL